MGEGDSVNFAEDTSLLQETMKLQQEVDNLKKELFFEKQQHKHWEELAMLFHDALWEQLTTKYFSHVISYLLLLSLYCTLPVQPLYVLLL